MSAPSPPNVRFPAPAPAAYSEQSLDYLDCAFPRPLPARMPPPADSGAPARAPHPAEHPADRRARVEFLRRREWTRRIAAWALHPPPAKDVPHAAHPHPPCDPWADPPGPHAFADADTPDAPPAEPYVIYTASPSPRPAPVPQPTPDAYTHALPPPGAPSHPPGLDPAPAPRRRRPGSPRSRHSSLSSISEVEEDDDGDGDGDGGSECGACV
ncbi:hypothetical protein AcV5_010263 [Taiwanofungus camphoratus]|nr:hypothetical protein AcV5_010263 [Antrodia cinnamomea]